MPQGFLSPDEAKLGEGSWVLTPDQCECLTDWWLAVRPHANTPNWDLVADCRIGGKSGILLVEAKAHKGELSKAGKTKPTTENGRANHAHIAEAIETANAALNAQESGWALSHDTHYQLCNRFAWSWKLATMGVPVVLVYLGFLNVDEMPGPFTSAQEWEDFVRDYSRDIIPEDTWASKVMVNGTPIYPVIRSLDHQWM